jgi:subtilisin family serine protease
LIRQYKYIPWALYEGDGPALASGRQALKALKIESCTPGRMHLAAVPDDPLYLPDQTAFHPDNPDADIFLPQAWDLTHDASNIVVAVIDSGIDPSHPDLVNNLWTNPAEAGGQSGVDDDHNGYIDDLHGWNFVDNNNNLYGNDPGGPNHGTKVSGVIGAQGNNGQGISGVCWQVQVMTLRAFSDVDASTTDTYIVDAFEYALSFPQVRVINASWGGTQSDELIKEEIVAAGQKGILVVAAAGNDGADIDLDGQQFYPASYNLDNLVSVAAIDTSGSLASFSNYGSQVSLAAPGDPVYSTLPGGLYGGGSGTSFSAPIVCGAAALMLARDPSLSPAQLKQRLIATARRTDPLSLFPLAGGLLNVQRFLLGPPGAARSGWALYR